VALQRGFSLFVGQTEPGAVTYQNCLRLEGTEHSVWKFVTRHGVGGGELGGAAMPHLAATADRIDYWIRRRVVPCPVHRKVNPTFERFVGLTAISIRRSRPSDAGPSFGARRG